MKRLCNSEEDSADNFENLKRLKNEDLRETEKCEAVSAEKEDPISDIDEEDQQGNLKRLAVSTEKEDFRSDIDEEDQQEQVKRSNSLNTCLAKTEETKDGTQLKQDPISDIEDDPEESKSSHSLNTRLGKCEVCAAQEARYTCPKCEVKTCCLNCVRIHKKELNCDGIRDRTKFIPLKQMTNMDFMSDYYFLEECTRYVEDRKTDQIKKYTRYNRDLPVHLKRLRDAAKERNINLRFLLQNFARHKENTTYFDWRTKKIWWRIKWIFVNAGNLCYTDAKCWEGEYLRDLLKKYVDSEEVEGNVPEKRKLEYYQSKGVQNLKVLLKAEGIKRCKNRFYLLDVNKTLKANLAGKTLVEYPWIYVSYEDSCEAFDVIDSDEDVESEAKHHEATLEAYRKELLQKQRQQQENPEEDVNEEIDEEKILKLASEKRKQERQLKRQEYEKKANNFLFTDEQLMEVLSSSSSEGEE